LDGHSALDYLFYLFCMPKPNKESENGSMRNVGLRFTRPLQRTGLGRRRPTDGAEAGHL